jgi:nucleoid-associated protein YgaU
MTTLSTAPATRRSVDLGVAGIVVPSRVVVSAVGRRVAGRVVALVMATLMGIGLVATVVGADAPLEVETHSVRAGDTLWAIAANRTPAGGDVRATVAEIVRHNELSGADLRVGQVLELPPPR